MYSLSDVQASKSEAGARRLPSQRVGDRGAGAGTDDTSVGESGGEEPAGGGSEVSIIAGPTSSSLSCRPSKGNLISSLSQTYPLGMLDCWCVAKSHAGTMTLAGICSPSNALSCLPSIYN